MLMTLKYLNGKVSWSYRFQLVDLLAAAKVVITSDEVVRGGKVTPLKTVVDSAVKDCPSVEKVFVVTRTGADVPMYRRDVFMKEVLYHFCVVSIDNGDISLS